MGSALTALLVAPQTSMNNPDLYPDMTKTSETHSLSSYKGKFVCSVLQKICSCLYEVFRKVIHHCVSVAELLNIKRFLCSRERVVMTGKTENRTLGSKDWPEQETWEKGLEMATVFHKTVDPQMMMMMMVIRSDQMAELLLSDWLECQSEEQDVLDQVPCPTEDKLKASANDHDDDDEGEPVLPCPQETDETEWSEEDSDWSDEDPDMSAESRVLWESFNSDPYNPLCFSCPTRVTIKPEMQQNTPSSSTAEHFPEKRVKKVRFIEESTIHYLETWDGASQAARVGSCWMEMARDRERFKRRVVKAGEIISPCLTTQHRARVLDKLFNHLDSTVDSSR